MRVSGYSYCNAVLDDEIDDAGAMVVIVLIRRWVKVEFGGCPNGVVNEMVDIREMLR